MKLMRLIGDVHGKTEEYKKIIDQIDYCSIQLGDFGFKKEHKWHKENVNSEYHTVLFGNHDYYPMVELPHSLGHYGYLDNYDIFYIRGANTPWFDRGQRNLGMNLFSDEELSWHMFNEAMKLYEKVKPGTVISHDCPQIIRENIFDIVDSSITSSGLDEMLNIHKPSKWFFGHHHVSTKYVFEGTEFRCLDELEYFDLEV